MNIQAVAVEKASGRAMMSGSHGFFSIGGIAGAGLVSALLACGFTPLLSVLVVVAALFALLAMAAGQLLALTGEDPSAPLFVRPHGRVLAIGLLCFILFLTESAMLDWSTLFLTHERGMASASGGLGYALFCISMTIGRLGGDRLINRIGRFRMLLGGSMCAAASLLRAIAIDVPAVTLLSFLLLGFGAANLVPLLFSVVGDPAGHTASPGAGGNFRGRLCRYPYRPRPDWLHRPFDQPVCRFWLCSGIITGGQRQRAPRDLLKDNPSRARYAN